MSSTGTVLVLADHFDPTVDLAVEELNRRAVPVFRADVADFPTRLTLSAALTASGWGGILRSAHRTLHLDDVRSVYYRRPGRPRFADDMAPNIRRVAELEARLGFGGLLTALPCRWLSPPGKATDAEFKPLQLRVAAEAGLYVPRTLITNDPMAASDFAASTHGRLVYKPFHPMRGTKDGKPTAVFTSMVDPADLPHPDIANTAHLFQEWVPKAYEVRLTVVGSRMFAAEIHAGSGQGRVDWRSDYTSHTYQVTEPPPAVADGVLRMLSVLGLPYGAFDFVVTPEGKWTFLEVNPSGQYGFIEIATGLPITAAIADYLEGTAA